MVRPDSFCSSSDLSTCEISLPALLSYFWSGRELYINPLLLRLVESQDKFLQFSLQEDSSVNAGFCLSPQPVSDLAKRGIKAKLGKKVLK